MRSVKEARAVAIVGLRHQEFIRLQHFVESSSLPFQLIYGGHISEGSNARKHAERASHSAQLVLWNPNGARKFAGGFLTHVEFRRIHGVSGATLALQQHAEHRPRMVG